MTTMLVDEYLETDSDLGLRQPPSLHNGDVTPAVRQMRRYAELTRLPFLCVDATTGVVLAASDDEALEFLPARVRSRLADICDVRTIEGASDVVFHALPLCDIDGLKTVGVTYCFRRPGVRPHDVVMAAAEQGWSQQQFDDWLSRQPYAAPELTASLLEMAVQQVEFHDREDQWERELEQLSNQIEHTYEEISLLHSLTRNLQISRKPMDLAELCLNRMHALIRCEGNVISLNLRDGESSFLVEGEVPFDRTGMERLIGRLQSHDWSRPLVKNHIAGTLLGADFPGLEGLVVVPIAEGAHRSGWMLSCNMCDGREFGTVEASLLSSIATILGTHTCNIELYREHDELLLSFVRSMVSTLDARDPYTRGHSDRVALIARRLAEELGLPAEDLSDIYMSGLLHDIGKIGVDDEVLRKPGRLTDDEFKQIQRHPVIGYEILRGLRNLQKVLPGVRSHHEAYDGSGYPDGLAGEDIPLMARILAVADGYDAMSSDRPYRKGMPLAKIDDILRSGAGQQWDARIVAAYFSAHDDVGRIAAEYSPDNGDLLDALRAATGGKA